jgi:hypothetical protein
MAKFSWCALYNCGIPIIIQLGPSLPLFYKKQRSTAGEKRVWAQSQALAPESKFFVSSAKGDNALQNREEQMKCRTCHD